MDERLMMSFVGDFGAMSLDEVEWEFGWCRGELLDVGVCWRR